MTKMKSKTISNDLSVKDYGFSATKKALLTVTPINFESLKHPIKRIKFKITFYWE
jgi:hypothetical protein